IVCGARLGEKGRSTPSEGCRTPGGLLGHPGGLYDEICRQGAVEEEPPASGERRLCQTSRQYPRINPWACRWHICQPTAEAVEQHMPATIGTTDSGPFSTHKASRTRNAFELSMQVWRHDTTHLTVSPPERVPLVRTDSVPSCLSPMQGRCAAMLQRELALVGANVLSLPSLKAWAPRTRIVVSQRSSAWGASASCRTARPSGSRSIVSATLRRALIRALTLICSRPARRSMCAQKLG